MFPVTPNQNTLCILHFKATCYILSDYDVCKGNNSCFKGTELQLILFVFERKYQETKNTNYLQLYIRLNVWLIISIM